MSARLASKAAQISAGTLAVLSDLVPQWLPGGKFDGDEYIARNPLRVDRNLGSFRINIRTGLWRDHAIGVGGRDAVSLYAYLHSKGDYRAALKQLEGSPLVCAAIASGIKARRAKPAKLLRPSSTKRPRAEHIYAKAAHLSGTPAAVYLHSRGLHPTDPWDRLRTTVQYYPGVGACPTLLASIETLDGSLAGLHRTYLQRTGAKLDVPNPRRTLGRVRGCAIHLGETTDQLVICEGLEDGLTLYQELGIPVWVAGGASLLHLMALPEAVQSLTIAADNDRAGERAAQRAADAFAVGSRTVRVMRPAPRFKDFNDQLRGITS